MGEGRWMGKEAGGVITSHKAATSDRSLSLWGHFPAFFWRPRWEVFFTRSWTA